METHRYSTQEKKLPDFLEENIFLKYKYIYIYNYFLSLSLSRNQTVRHDTLNLQETKNNEKN